jgi:hypothetical protein
MVARDADNAHLLVVERNIDEGGDEAENDRGRAAVKFGGHGKYLSADRFFGDP